MYGDEPRVELATNQSVKGGWHGLGLGPVVEQGHTTCNHDGAKTRRHRSRHQDAIAWNKARIRGGAYIDCNIAILHEHIRFISAEVSNRPLEGNRRRLAGLGIGDGMDGAQGGQRGRLCRPCSRGHSEEDDDQGNESLSPVYPTCLVLRHITPVSSHRQLWPNPSLPPANSREPEPSPRTLETNYI